MTVENANPSASVDRKAEIAELIRQGIAAHHQGDLVEAERMYRSALEIEPRSADALHLLGLIAHATGHLEQAVGLIRQAIAINPSHAPFHSNLGNAYLSMKQPAVAEGCLKQALALDPKLAAGHNNLGLAYSAMGRFGEAADSFRHAAALQPNLAEPLGNLANALRDQGRMDEAEEEARKAVAAAPLDPDHQARLARIIHLQGREAEAAALVEAAMGDHPEAASLLLAHGIIMMGMGRPVRAIQDFQRAIAVPSPLVETSEYLREAIARQPSEDEHVSRLRTAHASGRLRMRIDPEKLRFPHSPLRVEFYDTRAFMLVLGCWVGSFWLLPATQALIPAATVTLLYLLVGRKYVAGKMSAYALAKMLAEPSLLDPVWRTGALIMTDTATGREEPSPDGNWRLFVEDIVLSPKG
jgi:tetratricopeptide (TPR) repeat protein